jgi:thioredoxin reductase (NADPH)
MEKIADDLKVMPRTPLHAEHVDALRAAGHERWFEAGEMVSRIGDPMTNFIYVEEGEIELVDPFTDERYVESTIGPTQFVGEIAFLNGGAHSLALRAARPTRVIETPRKAVLDLMSKTPEMSDIILSVFAARRRAQFEDGDSSLVLIGAERDPAVQAVAAFASRNLIPHVSHALGSEEAADAALSCGVDGSRPEVIFGRDRVIDDPTPRKVAQLLGLDLTIECGEMVDLLIVGGGPAGVAAAVYAGAEGLDALVIEDVSIGGQAGTSSRIENYMGFPTGISGADLVWRGQVQAMKFGTRFAMPRRVTGLATALDGRSLCAELDHGEQMICARAVLVATGVQYRRLPLPRLQEFEGRGVYYAATEMEGRFCAGTEAVIVGGGNSAGQAAMFLSRHARHVHVLVRSHSLAASMSDYLRSRLDADERITVHYGCQIAALHGEEDLNAITIDTGDRTERIDTNALFIMAGAAPNTDWLSELVELDDKGFVKTGEAAGAGSPYGTSHDRIFAVGDVRAGSVKRVASSVGEGSVVVSAIWSMLDAPPPAEG